MIYLIYFSTIFSISYKYYLLINYLDNEDNIFGDLANMMSEINLKQKLTKELELSQCRLLNLKQHYETKLQQLQSTITLTQEERNTVISFLSNFFI